MKLLPALLLLFPLTSLAQTPAIEAAVQKIEAKTIAWRRDIHQHPELGNREVRTAKLVADHLRSLGLQVQEGVGKTGVVALLKGGKPGPVVGLRADMDALPVAERAALPFASKVTTEYNGQTTGVMHACGHDTHVAMLLSAAEILTSMKANLAGSVKFIFQPAEEGPPAGEEGGAALMVKEGALTNPKVDVMIGLHIDAQTPVGTITYREQGIMAASDWFSVSIKGRQTHGAEPWLGIDPVIIGAQITTAFQNIIGRQMDLTRNPVVISTTMFKAGVRENIIPETVTLGGTIRTLDKEMRADIYERMRRTAVNIAEASGATAELRIDQKTGVTFNDPAFTRRMVPSLEKAAPGKVAVIPPVTGAEDFSFFADEVPSLYFFVGGMAPNGDPKTAPAHHTPDFAIDESGMRTGVKAFVYMVTDYLGGQQGTKGGAPAKRQF